MHSKGNVSSLQVTTVLKQTKTVKTLMNYQSKE